VSLASHPGWPFVTNKPAPPVSSRSSRGDLELIRQIDSALDVLHGKWKVHLLFVMARGVHRHSRLLDSLPGASKKIMTETLRALERDGFLVRKVYAEVPVRVEYSLTPLGWTMTAPLIALAEWGDKHGDEVNAARAEYRRRQGESTNGNGNGTAPTRGSGR
jgi:DNA-binding HxlR family transcriptional regulator